MHVRIRLSAYVGIALAMLSGMRVPRLPTSNPIPSGRPRRGGKGKGRMGASKAFHAPTHTQRDHGKAARRRRRAARLRRG